MKKSIEVVGAVIESDGTILCTQRGPQGQLAGLWEFPGGKVEPDETPAEALAREISEELGCDIAVGDQIMTTRHEYDFAVVTLTTYWCGLIGGTPMLTEHAAMTWLHPVDLRSLAWAPADLPTVDFAYRQHTNSV